MNGRWKGKAVHFSSCDTLNTDAEAISAFRKETQAALVSGYKESIDFLDGALMDLVFATISSEYELFSYVPARLEKEYPELLSRTGLIFG